MRVDTPDRALELLRLFSGRGSCLLFPDQPWVEVRAAEKDGHLHDVTRQVLEDGMVTVIEDRIVLANARAVVGSCRSQD